MKLNQTAVENFLDHFTEISYLDNKQQKEIFINLFDVNEKVESFIRHDILNMGLHKIDGEIYTEDEAKRLLVREVSINDEKMPWRILLEIIQKNQDVANLIIQKYQE